MQIEKTLAMTRVDSFTLPLHNPNGRQGLCNSLGTIALPQRYTTPTKTLLVEEIVNEMGCWQGVGVTKAL